VSSKNTDAAVDTKITDSALNDAGVDAFTCAANPAGLAGRWRAEMNTNDDLNASPGTQIGGVVYSPGKHGFAFVLDGTKLVSVADNDALWPAESFSLEAWFKTTGTTSAQIMQKYQCSNTCPAGQSTALWAIGLGATGTPYFDVRTDASQNIVTLGDTQHTLNDGAWHHFVAVRDIAAAQLIMYVDGALAATTAITGTDLGALTNADSEADPITIGAGTVGGTNNHQSFFTGSIDEISYYGVALTATDVARIYAAPEGECH
jgi:hypothetical protein